MFADVFAGSRTGIEAADYEPPAEVYTSAGFATLLLYFAKNMVYCICNLALAI